MKDSTEDALKIERTIKSCTNLDQLNVCKNMVDNFYAKCSRGSKQFNYGKGLYICLEAKRIRDHLFGLIVHQLVICRLLEAQL